MIIRGDFTTTGTGYLTNSGSNACTNYDTYIYCSTGLVNGSKWGILTEAPFDIPASNWYYAYVNYSSTYEPLTEQVNAYGTEMILYGPKKTAPAPTGPTEAELRTELDAWLATLSVGAFDTTQHLCAGQFFEGTVAGRPVVAFIQSCPTHNASLDIMFGDATLFGSTDTDIVVGSNHSEGSCSATTGSCTVNVRQNQAFGIMLGETFVSGDYSTSV